MISLIEIFRILRKSNTPTEIDWKAIFSSVWHKTEKLPIEQILGLQEEIAKATTNFKGYHTDEAALNAAYPKVDNKKDFFAWVGSPYPGTVYKVFENKGAWTDTGQIPTQQEIDLAAYAKKTEVSRITGTLYLGDFTSKDVARNSVPSDLRQQGLLLTYQVDGKVIKEYFDSPVLNSWLSDTLWARPVKGVYTPEELIPYKSNGETRTTDLFFYADQSSIRGKEIDRFHIRTQRSGTLGIYVSKNIEVGKSRTDVRTYTLQVIEGEQILKLPEIIKLEPDEWLGVGRGTAGFFVDIDFPNPIAGGYFWSSSGLNTSRFYPDRDLCVGVIEKGAKEKITIEGVEIGNEGDAKDTSVLALNAHKMGDILAMNKAITSSLGEPGKTRFVTFSHITDTHVNWRGVSRALDFMNRVSSGCDFTIVSGDIVNNSGDDATPYLNLINASRKNVYHCLGNHDLLPTKEAMFNKFYAPIENKIQFGNGRELYYFKDIKDIRFIFLHDFDLNKFITYYSDAQLKWFIEALKGCSFAVVVKHQPMLQVKGTEIIDIWGNPIKGYNDFFDYNKPTKWTTAYGNKSDPIVDIVEAWRRKEVLSKKYYSEGGDTGEIDVDFSNDKGEFITYLCGHEHYEKFGYVGNTTQLLIVNGNTEFSDVYSDIPRFKNTITEDCINYMNISLDEKTLTVLRLGADVAYTGRDRKKICVTWDKDKMINS